MDDIDGIDRQRSEGDDWMSSDTGDDTSIGLTGSNLGESVGLRLSLSVVGGVRVVGVDGASRMEQRSEASAVSMVNGSDDTSIGLTGSDLIECVGLGVPGDSHQQQAQLRK